MDAVTTSSTASETSASARVPRGEEPEARDDDPPERQREHGDEARATGSPPARRATMSAGIGRRSKRRAAVRERVHAGREHAARRRRARGPSRATCRSTSRRATTASRRVRGVAPARSPSSLDAHRPSAFMAIWTAVYEQHDDEQPAQEPECRPGARAASRRDAPTNTPSAIGPAMYGSISSRRR